MLLPDKYIPLEDSYIGMGAVLLKSLSRPATVEKLWKRLGRDRFETYERFIITLVVLYRAGLVELGPDNKLRRTHA